MSSNPLITPTVATEDQAQVDAIFKGVEEHLGFVPDGLRLYSISPPLLEGFVKNIGYFMTHPKHSQRLLAMIRYLVSSNAGCTFCIDFNSGLLMNMGVTAEQLQASQENSDNAQLEEAEKVILKSKLRTRDFSPAMKRLE